ncbi:hypothetical protein LSTR_LSTR003467 [Laodelphax striatellus]|uniref:C2H2-type domain-containing protein n=1 Tax=Laodelphax striatellus TaxID=195883 RepID=A0A482WZP3_LAOST|nr:hypothetical protein LSTR_LSTR003467 [Laodelphax striatellus]
MDAMVSSVLSSFNLPDNLDGQNPDNSRPIADSQHQAESSRSMDTCDGSVQDQDSSEKNYQVQTNSHNHGQCSDNNYQYPFEMIMLTPEVVVEEGLQEKKEDIEEETLMNNQSFPPESSCRSTIKQKNLKEFYEKGMKKSDGEHHSPSTMIQIQDIPPNIQYVSTEIISNFNNEKDPVPLNKQDLSPAGIEGQGNFHKLLYTDNGYVKKRKNYKCKYCVYKTNKKSNYTNHIHTHTGEKPYSCQFCDKAFNMKSNLTTHLRTHSGESPFSCKFCDKSFAQKVQLNLHLPTHTRKCS